MEAPGKTPEVLGLGKTFSDRRNREPERREPAVESRFTADSRLLAGILARPIYKGHYEKQEDGAATVGIAMPEKEHVISTRRPAMARGNQ